MSIAVTTGNRGYKEENMSIADPYVSVEFEVYGKVQGVNFPKCCKDMCEQLNVSGWIKNTKKGTIQGRLQGQRSKVEQMVMWISHTGSPGSQIERCDLNNWQNLARPDYKGFQIRF